MLNYKVKAKRESQIGNICSLDLKLMNSVVMALQERASVILIKTLCQ